MTLGYTEVHIPNAHGTVARQLRRAHGSKGQDAGSEVAGRTMQGNA
jgi:hypothetical protein